MTSIFVPRVLWFYCIVLIEKGTVMFRTLLRFVRIFFLEINVRREVCQRIQRDIHFAMITCGATYGDVRAAEDVANNKFNRIHRRNAGYVAAMRLLFEKERITRNAYLAGAERLILVELYFSALDDILHAVTASSQACDIRTLVHDSLFLRAIAQCLFIAVRGANTSNYREHAFEAIFFKLRDHCIDDAHRSITLSDQSSPEIQQCRHTQKTCMLAELMLHMLYPCRTPRSSDIHVLAAFVDSLQMSADIADLYDDVLTRNNKSVVYTQLRMHPDEYEVVWRHSRRCSWSTVNPFALRRYAPSTYLALCSRHRRLGNEVVHGRNDPAYRLLRIASDVFFMGYPFLRNCIHLCSSRCVMS